MAVGYLLGLLLHGAGLRSVLAETALIGSPD
jgi:hypothetical protein